MRAARDERESGGYAEEGVHRRDRESSTFKPRLWVPGDWNAFFGLGTNVLLNVLVLSGLALVRRPAARPTPSSGGSCRRSASPCRSATCSTPTWPTSSARKEGRDDVAAMPYGPSVPHYFFVTFVIMLPVVLKTNGDVIEGLAGRARVGLLHRRRSS